MKIDVEYMKGMLDAFEAAENPTTDIEELKGRGFDYEEPKFVFHFQILADRDLLRAEQGDELGYVKGADGFVSWAVIPLRLTANGHDFIEALRNKEVWEKIKTDFKDASIGSLLSISKQLLEGYAKKKLSKLLDADE